MREIKFRAWDKEYQEMKYNAEQAYDGCGQLHAIDCFGQLLEEENYKVMQYTGLKDKNGKEIYEGDILLTKDIEGEKYQTCVTYENGMFLSGEEPLYDDVFLFEAEVVGNIYENPELLIV